MAIINFYPSKYPFIDFAFVSGTSVDLPKNLSALSVSYMYLNKNKIQLISTDTVDKKNLILSGYGIVNNKWVYGADDLTTYNEDILQLAKGCFSYAFIKDESISFFTDFFGGGKIFYFTNNGVSVVANRLHLLLIILRLIGYTIELDYDIIGVYCSNLRHIFLQQPLSSELFFKNIKILDIAEKLDLYGNKIKVSPSKYGLIISNEKCGSIFPNGSLEYRQLINKAKTEIIENLDIITKSNKFDHFVCDLTGGKDSRISFAAITNIDNFAKIIKIHNFGDEHEKKCVASIMHAYNLEYDPVFFRSTWWNRFTGKDITNTDIEEYFETLTSFHLGTYWDTDSYIGRFNVKLKDTLRFTGSYGEIFSRNIQSYLTIKENLDETINSFCEQLKNLSSIKDYSDKLKEIITNSVQNCPAKSELLKLKNLHIAHRMKFHFSNTADGAQTPTFAPLLSIEAFRAYCYSLRDTSFPQFYYDLLYALNPLVACFEYSKESHNSERLNNANRINFDKPEYTKILINANADLIKFNEYYNLSISGSFTKTKELATLIEYNYHNWFNNDLKNILIKDIMEMVEIFKANVPFEFYAKTVLPILEILQTVQDKNKIGELISISRRFKNIIEAIKINNAHITEFHIKPVKSIIYDYNDFNIN